MKSPCHDCRIHQGGQDKNGPVCLNCPDRLAYVRSLGGMTHSVPDNLADITQPVLSGENTMEDTPRVCTECGAPGMTEKDFQKNRFGLMKICKGCLAVRRAAGFSKKKTAGTKAAPEIKKKTPAPDKKAVQETPSAAAKTPAAGLVLTIDFSKHQDVYDDLINTAKSQIRSPENMILYALKKVIRYGEQLDRVEKNLQVGQ